MSLGPRVVRALLRRDGDRCHWCGVQLVTDRRDTAPDALSVDHLRPRSLGGGDALVNLVLACRWCNNYRGAMPVLEWEASWLLATRRREVLASIA